LEIGLDIGGANLKYVSIDKGKVYCRQEYFPIWKKRELNRVLSRFNFDGNVAVTMSAESSDIFENRKDGVSKILDVLEKIVKDALILTNKPEFITIDEARKKPLSVASANWIAAPWLLTEFADRFIYVDVGSTTTDVVSVKERKILFSGMGDMERAIAGSLIYIGALRTNLATIKKYLSVDGKTIRVSSEYFATMGDVNIVLSKIKEEEYTSETPDGRDKDVLNALKRIARVFHTDFNMVERRQIEDIARQIYSEAIDEIVNAITKNSSGIKTGVYTGSGWFMAKEALKLSKIESDSFETIIKKNTGLRIKEKNVAQAFSIAYRMRECG